MREIKTITVPSWVSVKELNAEFNTTLATLRAIKETTSQAKTAAECANAVDHIDRLVTRVLEELT